MSLTFWFTCSLSPPSCRITDGGGLWSEPPALIKWAVSGLACCLTSTCVLFCVSLSCRLPDCFWTSNPVEQQVPTPVWFCGGFLQIKKSLSIFDGKKKNLQTQQCICDICNGWHTSGLAEQRGKRGKWVQELHAARPTSVNNAVD